jgi:hypothetical protein
MIRADIKIMSSGKVLTISSYIMLRIYGWSYELFTDTV